MNIELPSLPSSHPLFSTKTLSCSLHGSAFVEDLLIGANSIAGMQASLDIVSEFNNIHGLKSNSAKGRLILSNIEYTSHITFGGLSLQPISPDTPFRYLGGYFSSALSSSTNASVILKHTEEFVNTVSKKKLTAKQTIYLVNNVLFPSLLYRWTTYFPPWEVISKIEVATRELVRAKLNLAQDSSRCILHSNKFVGLNPFENLVLKQFTTECSIALNSPGIHGDAANLLVGLLQSVLSLPLSPLASPIPFELEPSTHWMGPALDSLFQHRLSILDSKNNFNIPGPSLLLFHYLPPTSHKQLAPHFGKSGLLFLSQLSLPNKRPLLWRSLHGNLHRQRMDQPQWFSQLCQLTNSGPHCFTDIITSALASTPPQEFFSASSSRSDKPKLYIFKAPDLSPIITQFFRTYQHHQNKLITLIHLTRTSGRNVRLKPCKGCSRRSENAHPTYKCVITVPINYATPLPPDDDGLTPEYWESYSHHLLPLPTTFDLDPEQHLTFPHYQTWDYLSQLFLNRRDLHLSTGSPELLPGNHKIFTDGGHKTLPGSMPSTAFGIFFPDSGLRAFGRIPHGLQSSFRAELWGILFAVLISPCGSTLEIFTDSKSVVERFKTINSSRSQRTMLGTNCSLDWILLKTVMSVRNTSCSLKWVKGHSTCSGNIEADRFATLCLSKPPLQLYEDIYSKLDVFAHPAFSNVALNLDPIKFIKTLDQTRQNLCFQFFSQGDSNTRVDIEATSISFHNGSSPFKTDFRAKKTYSFKSKLLAKDLPTKDLLHKRWPSQCPDNICTFCDLSVTESTDHFLECPRTLRLFPSALDSALKHSSNVWTSLNFLCPTLWYLFYPLLPLLRQ
jgi:ribonuclease HI